MKGRSRALQNGFVPAVPREEQGLVMESKVYLVQNMETKWGSVRAEITHCPGLLWNLYFYCTLVEKKTVVREFRFVIVLPNCPQDKDTQVIILIYQK